MIVIALLVPVVLLLIVLALDVFENLLFPPVPASPPQDISEPVHGHDRAPAVTHREEQSPAPGRPGARWRPHRDGRRGGGPGRGPRCRHEP